MSHCPSCQAGAICPGASVSESEAFNREKHNVVVRQCCDLIDEKRELERKLAEAEETMRDVAHVVENFSAISSPLYQIRERIRSTLSDVPRTAFPATPVGLHANTDARAWADHFTECTAVNPSIAEIGVVNGW
jgi:seryl-tRNA synthetase